MASAKTVYLAGPITGCTWEEANDWRTTVIHNLGHANIKGISPLRCEPLVGSRYAMGYEDPKFGTSRSIAAKNFFDVQACDMLLAYMPLTRREDGTTAGLPQQQHSKGTLCELAWGFALRKPTILVTDDLNLAQHPVVNACAGWLLDNLEDGIEVCIGILADYAKGNIA